LLKVALFMVFFWLMYEIELARNAKSILFNIV
jgi:hypothetical protein